MPSASDAGVTAPGEQAEGVERFTRHRYEMPLLYVFLGLATVELFAVHLLLSLWSATAAWVMSGLTLLAMVQIGALIRGMIQNPTTVDARGLIIRHGRAGKFLVPFSQIASVENVAFMPEARGRDVFRTSLLAQPNVAIRLNEPLRIVGRDRNMVTLRLDEPATFLQLLRARLSANSAATAS